MQVNIELEKSRLEMKIKLVSQFRIGSRPFNLNLA